jgi:hypothetical protein
MTWLTSPPRPYLAPTSSGEHTRQPRKARRPSEPTTCIPDGPVPPAGPLPGERAGAGGSRSLRPEPVLKAPPGTAELGHQSWAAAAPSASDATGCRGPRDLIVHNSWGRARHGSEAVRSAASESVQGIGARSSTADGRESCHRCIFGPDPRTRPQLPPGPTAVRLQLQAAEGRPANPDARRPTPQTAKAA